MTNAIAELNDEFRQNLFGRELNLTQSVAALPIDDIKSLCKLVMTFDSFNEDNEPYSTHDFGSIDFKENTYFWKIDCYDINYENGSEDPSDPFITKRVLTLMECSEY